MRKSLILLGILALVGGAWAADNATEVARIKVATPGLVLNLKGRPSMVIGKFEDVPVTAARELTVRPGSYETNSILLCVQDAKKEIWTLTCARNFEKNSRPLRWPPARRPQSKPGRLWPSRSASAALSGTTSSTPRRAPALRTCSSTWITSGKPANTIRHAS